MITAKRQFDLVTTQVGLSYSPNIKFTEIGFLNVIKQVAEITDGSKLDELYDDLCVNYGFPQDWVNFNKQKEDFVNLIRLR